MISFQKVCSSYSMLLIISIVSGFLAMPSISHAKSSDADTVRILFTSLPDRISPFGRLSHPELENRIFPGLVQLNSQNEVAPDIAERWEISEDGLVYTFYLRRDVKWEDGTKLTARDVVFTFNSALQQIKNFPRKSHLKPIRSVTALDDYTVRVDLKEPVAWFLNTLWMGIAPEHILRGKNLGRLDMDYHIGSGPYRVKEYVRDQFLVLEASPTYFGNKARIKRVVFILTGRGAYASYAMMLTSGKADIGVLPAANLPRTEGTDIRLITFPSTDLRSLQFNRRNPIWQDRRVRQAIGYALNREEMVKAVVHGYGVPAYHAFKNSWAEQAIEGAKCFSYDLKKAASLMEEAGWKKGKDGFYEKDAKRFSFTLQAWWAWPDSTNTVIMVRQQLKKFGMEVILAEWTGLEFDYEGVDAFLGTPSTRWDPGAAFFNLYHSGKIGAGTRELKWHYNSIKYDNPDMDRILNRLKNTLDREKREKAIFELQNIMYEDPPAIYLTNDYTIVGVHKSIQGIPKNLVLGHGGMGFYADLENWHIESGQK